MKNQKLAVFILSKNEEKNISRCLDSLKNAEWPTFVLDSGSTDSTLEICSKYSFAKVIHYKYTNHCDAYNTILTNLSVGYDFAIILDSDMVISSSLKAEILDAINAKSINWSAINAEVEMWIEGIAIPHASLYPPKPFLFQTGQPLFVSTGHAEKLIEGKFYYRLKNKLIHDDRKCYSSYLQSQFRYSKNLIDRYLKGTVSSRDKLRIKYPLLILAVPFFSLVIKRGFMDGTAGIIYALDRLIAEAIMYRQSLASRVHQTK